MCENGEEEKSYLTEMDLEKPYHRMNTDSLWRVLKIYVNMEKV